MVFTVNFTFSAGEEFTYNLKSLNRATVVGETTGGGAHPGSPFRIHPHFEVFIPKGKAINPVTGKNWEGCGVEPDVPTTADQALDTAFKLALEEVIKSLDKEESPVEKKLLNEAKNAHSKIIIKQASSG